jgi:hypothetical protein
VSIGRHRSPIRFGVSSPRISVILAIKENSLASAALKGEWGEPHPEFARAHQATFAFSFSDHSGGRGPCPWLESSRCHNGAQLLQQAVWSVGAEQAVPTHSLQEADYLHCIYEADPHGTLAFSCEDFNKTSTMTDPFSIGTGIVSVIGVALQLTIITRDFASGWKNCPDEVSSLHQELTYLPPRCAGESRSLP